MVFCVVFVFVCTLVFAVNGQHDNKYEDLYNEVHNLKSFIFKINEELDNFKKQYDEVRKELQDVRSKPWLMDTRTSMKLQKDYQDENEEYGDSNTLNKRAAIVPTSSHHWNASTASTPSCQCLNGSKGEKGESGLPGPKGDTGNTGPRGDTGAQGPTGRRGHTGPAGSTGPKGEKGSIGGTGPHGPKGIQGSAGLKGIPGLKGEPGPPGLPGLKGEPAAHSHQVAFSASSKLTINQGNQVIHHTHTITNVGHDYSRSTGVFTCDVDGIYVFTWSLEVTQGQNVTSRIDVDATTSGYPLEARTTNLLNSGSRTITARLARGQTVQIITSSHDNNVCSVTCNFSGFLLS